MKQHDAISTTARAIRKSFGAILRRIVDDAGDAHDRNMQREIQRLIGQSDEHLSDEAERRITGRLTRNSSYVP